MYLLNSKKSTDVIGLIREALDILVSVGIPVEDKTERSLERIAMAFLAVAGVTATWTEAKGLQDRRFLKTRDIINFNNANFEEAISSGSYDDIRRKDLKLLVLAGLVVNSAENPNAATNDPTRGYSLETSFKALVVSYKTVNWPTNLAAYLAGGISLKDQLARKRTIQQIPVTLPDGKQLAFSAGQHNLLQKLVIEEFLPRYGQHCQILYVGDTAKKMLHIEEKTLKTLNFFELSHDELPDIIAYNATKNWLYLIEAVHSSGSINEVRLFELKALTQGCKAEIIYVTAFLNRAEFRKWAGEIAWESEVWIADNPDHLIHFNGDKFLGPYKN
jgi:hypothetical protein